MLRLRLERVSAHARRHDRIHRRARLRAAIVLAVIGAMGGSPLIAQSARLRLGLDRLELAAGQDSIIPVEAVDASGAPVQPGPRLTYESRNPAIASVDSSGRVHGRLPGRTEIRITASRAAPELLRVFVRPAEVAAPAPTQPRPGSGAMTAATHPSTPPVPAGEQGQLQFVLPAERLVVGERAPYRLLVQYSNGPARELSRAEITLTSDSVVVIDTAQRRITAIGTGQAILTIKAPGAKVFGRLITVEQTALSTSIDSLYLVLGEEGSPRVTIPDQNDRPYLGDVTWASSNPAVAEVDPANGRVVARAVGSTELIVRAPGFEKRMGVQVHPEYAEWSLKPGRDKPVILPMAQTQEFSLVGHAPDYPDGVPPVRWEVGDTSIATFDPATRSLTAVNIGQTTLRAIILLADYPPREWSIEVVGGQVMADRPLRGLLVGATDTLRAMLGDAAGTRAPVPVELNWLSDHPDIVATSAEGVIRAVRPGKATLTGATPWGGQTSVTVYVVEELLVSVRGPDGYRIAGLQLGPPPLLRTITTGSGTHVHATMSPDHTRIVFASVDGENDLYVARPDGSALEQLTSGPARDESPVWSPDGEQIYFASNRSGRSAIYAMGADGTGYRLLTDTLVISQSPALSADGGRLAFSSVRGNQYDIYDMDISIPRPTTIGLERRVVGTPANEKDPRYFPNGDLAYILETTVKGVATRVLMRLPRGASSPTPLTPPALRVQTYALAPSGRYAVFTVIRKEGGEGLYMVDLSAERPAAPTPLYNPVGGSVTAPAFVIP